MIYDHHKSNTEDFSVKGKCAGRIGLEWIRVHERRSVAASAKLANADEWLCETNER
jgi:hypothetical protein